MSSAFGLRVFRIGLGAFTVLTFFYLVLPTFVIIPLSFSSSLYLSFPPPGWSVRWYVNLWHSDTYLLAVSNSVRIGLPAALIATGLGTLAAIGLVRGRPRAGRALSALVIAPMMLPQIILAIGLFSILAKFGLTGGYAGVILGHSVVCMPLVFITVAAALRSYDPNFELAAMTMGANWWNTFRFVTFPMVRLGMAIGAIFAFSFSFDEIILALFLTNAQTLTLPKQLYGELRFNMTPTIAAASTLVITLSLLLLAASALLDRRSRRARTVP
jgi:ABC-type spermidine/putrescine transport system permease subunit II